MGEDKNDMSHLFSSPTSNQRRDNKGTGLSFLEASREKSHVLSHKLIRNTVGHPLSATTLGSLGSDIREHK